MSAYSSIPDVLALCRKLLAYDTINPPGQERSCVRYLGELLEEAGLSVWYSEFAAGRTSLIATLPGLGGGPGIGFAGHLDTVPLGAAPWTRDPFAGQVEGDVLYGRGASDMKSGVAAMMVMALRLAEMTGREKDIVLILTAGEETTCQGASHLAESGLLPEVGALVVGEPTSNQPVIAHKGCVRYRLITRGTTAHASMPERGDNAIHKAADVVQALRRFRFRVAAHPLLGPATLSVGTIAGGANINSVPDRAELGVDIRLLPGQDDGSVRRELAGTLGAGVEIELLELALPVESDPADPWLGRVSGILTRRSGSPPALSGVPYFTDASVLTPALGHPPTLILGPGEAAMAHTTDECCRVSRLEEAVEIYTELAAEWCGVRLPR